MGARSRRKGRQCENEVVKAHLALALDAERISESGMPGDDVRIGSLHGECKRRGTGGGFKIVEKWLGACDVLFLRRDQEKPGQKVPPPLVVLPWRTWERAVRALAEKEGWPAPVVEVGSDEDATAQAG